MEEAQRNGRQLRTTGTGPASTADSISGEDAVQRRIQQQKEEDDRLLLDAGIEADDMGEEEKRQILEALRQSLPAPKKPSPHASHQAPLSDEDNTREEDGPKSAEEPPPPQQSVADEDNREEMMEVQEGPPPPAQSLEDRANSQERMELEEEMASPVQSLEVSPLRYDSEEEEGGQECDSTTVTAPASDDRATAAGLSDPRRETGLAQEVEECDQVAGGDPSDSDSASDLDTDLLTRSRKKLGGQQCPDMRLSSQQKEQGQSRFKELFNRTRLSQSQGWEPSQSAGEDGQSGNRSVHSSQDLFQEHSPNEEHGSSTQPDHSSTDAASRTQASHSASPAMHVTRSTPSPPSPPQEKRSSPGDREDRVEEKERECLEDAETLPPEDFEVEEEEVEHQGPCGDKEADSGRRSPVYPMQVTQVSCSSPSPDTKTHAHRYFLTPSKLPVEDDDDDRPLLHDNWFSWPRVPPVCCLHRTYRTSSKKRQEVAPDTKPYFCPQRESVAAYSEVIACMLDSYLQKFTAVQRQLHTLMPWGKPVRAGMHQSGSLDVRKRGQPEFKVFGLEEEEEEDDDDFQIAKPPQLKAIMLRRKRKISDDDVPGEAEADTKVKVEVDVDEGEGHVAVTLDDGGDAAAYDAETQPMDSDSELPDLHIEQASGGNGTWGAKAREREKVKAPSPTVVSEDSQSSSSLLNEQGDLYSTQLPRRKRTGQVEDREVMVMRVKRPRRAAQVAEAKENSPEKLRPLSRKRKQVPSSSVDSKVYLASVNDDDQEEDGASFLPIKVQVEKKRRGYVHISSRAVGGEGKAVTVQPAPGGSQSLGGRSGPSASFEELKDGKPNPQPCGSSNVSSSSHVPWGAAGGVGEEDSDDSVQYLDPPPGNESAPPGRIGASPARIGRHRAGQDDQLEEEEDQEDRGHKAVSAARLHAQEPEVWTVQESAEERSEELITCPLCNKQFPSSVIERHASDCSLEMEREEPPALHQSAGPLSIPPASQLRRRPLRGQLENEREEEVCGLCHVRQQGRAALKRHFEQCRQKYEKEEASSSSGQDLPMDTRRAYPTRAAQSNWLTSYRIPRKVEGAATSTRVSRQALPRLAEEEDDVIEEESNDSDKDPPLRPSEEDKQQEKNDKEEDRQKKRVGAARERR